MEKVAAKAAAKAKKANAKAKAKAKVPAKPTAKAAATSTFKRPMGVKLMARGRSGGPKKKRRTVPDGGGDAKPCRMVNRADPLGRYIMHGPKKSTFLIACSQAQCKFYNEVIESLAEEVGAGTITTKAGAKERLAELIQEYEQDDGIEEAGEDTEPDKDETSEDID